MRTSIDKEVGDHKLVTARSSLTWFDSQHGQHHELPDGEKNTRARSELADAELAMAAMADEVRRWLGFGGFEVRGGAQRLGEGMEAAAGHLYSRLAGWLAGAAK